MSETVEYMQRQIAGLRDDLFAAKVNESTLIERNAMYVNALQEQDAKIEALILSLLKYGRHDNGNGYLCERAKNGDHVCTCGLSAAIDAARAQGGERGA